MRGVDYDSVIYKAHPPRAVIEDFGKRLPKAVDETPFTIFVCGPGFSRRSGATLRRYISVQIERKISGVTVVWGEHRDFRGQVGKVVLRKFNDVTKELDFAQKESDLVVIFPDSPGSFIELGIFGMHPRVCARLVIVFDKRYKGSKSFAINAMARAARNQKATIRFVRYQDRRNALRQIEALVRRCQESKYNSTSYAAH
jgi:hypothetical protein